jgi:amidase
VHRLGGPRAGLRDRWRRGVDTFFRGYDALITPALARPPIRARHWARATWLGNVRSNARYAPFGALWNLAGAPAGVVPVTRHGDGTPVAVQIVGAPGADERVLAVMRAVERAAAGRV